jgi:hypothetical protein
MTQLRGIVAGYSVWRTGFSSRPVSVGFVWHKMASGQGFPRHYHYTPLSYTLSLQRRIIREIDGFVELETCQKKKKKERKKKEVWQH